MHRYILSVCDPTAVPNNGVTCVWWCFCAIVPSIHTFCAVLGQGIHVPYDPAMAQDHFQQAADKGLAAGHNGLGILYYNGEGVAKNTTLAKLHFEMAANKSSADSMFNLGTMHLRGEPGVVMPGATAAVEVAAVVSIRQGPAMRIRLDCVYLGASAHSFVVCFHLQTCCVVQVWVLTRMCCWLWSGMTKPIMLDIGEHLMPWRLYTMLVS